MYTVQYCRGSQVTCTECELDIDSTNGLIQLFVVNSLSYSEHLLSFGDVLHNFGDAVHILGRRGPKESWK